MSKVTQKDLLELENKVATFVRMEGERHLRGCHNRFVVDENAYYLERIRSEITKAEARMDAKLKAVLDHLNAVLITDPAHTVPLTHRVVCHTGGPKQKEPSK
jgi:hypothetical protein